MLSRSGILMIAGLVVLGAGIVIAQQCQQVSSGAAQGNNCSTNNCIPYDIGTWGDQCSQCSMNQIYNSPSTGQNCVKLGPINCGNFENGTCSWVGNCINRTTGGPCNLQEIDFQC